jgi:hypothetical protein
VARGGWHPPPERVARGACGSPPTSATSGP